MIGEVKDEKREMDGSKGLVPYQYMLTNKKKADDFRERFGL